MKLKPVSNNILYICIKRKSVAIIITVKVQFFGMFKFSVNIIILWMQVFIDDTSSKTLLEIDCRRDYTLTKLTTPNKYFTTCPSMQSALIDTKCFGDCFDDSNTV